MTMNEKARWWLQTDPGLILEDVHRLGGVQAAADYSADLAGCKANWESLDSDEGRVALADAIRALVEEQKENE